MCLFLSNCISRGDDSLTPLCRSRTTFCLERVFAPASSNNICIKLESIAEAENLLMLSFHDRRVLYPSQMKDTRWHAAHCAAL
jgi:hypothetical protein